MRTRRRSHKSSDSKRRNKRLRRFPGGGAFFSSYNVSNSSEDTTPPYDSSLSLNPLNIIDVSKNGPGERVPLSMSFGLGYKRHQVLYVDELTQDFTVLTDINILALMVSGGVHIDTFPPNLIELFFEGEDIVDDIQIDSPITISSDIILPTSITTLIVSNGYIKSTTFNGIMNCNKLESLYIKNCKFEFNLSTEVIPPLPDQITKIRVSNHIYTETQYPTHIYSERILVKYDFTNVPKSIEKLLIDTECIKPSEAFISLNIDLENNVNRLNITSNTVIMLNKIVLDRMKFLLEKGNKNAIYQKEISPPLDVMLLFDNEFEGTETQFHLKKEKYNKVSHFFSGLLTNKRNDMDNLVRIRARKGNSVLNKDSTNNINTFLGGKSIKRKRIGKKRIHTSRIINIRNTYKRR